jgi:hypothetical protein
MALRRSRAAPPYLAGVARLFDASDHQYVWATSDLRGKRLGSTVAKIAVQAGAGREAAPAAGRPRPLGRGCRCPGFHLIVGRASDKVQVAH